MNTTGRSLIRGALRLQSIARATKPNPVLAISKSRSRVATLYEYGNGRFLSSNSANKYRPPVNPRFQEVDEHGFQIPIEDSTRYTDEEKADRKKKGLYYSLLIASLVGLTSSSYLLYIRMLNVEAKSVEDGGGVKSEGDLEDGTQPKQSSKKDDEIALHKSKAGFRERKVRKIYIY